MDVAPSEVGIHESLSDFTWAGNLLSVCVGVQQTWGEAARLRNRTVVEWCPRAWRQRWWFRWRILPLRSALQVAQGPGEGVGVETGGTQPAGLQGESEGRGAVRCARLTLGYRRGQLEEEILHSTVELQRYLAVAFEPGPSAVVLWHCARAAKREAGSPL